MLETVLLYALGILIVVVGVALSIGLHEVGHLVPAKRFGVKVGQYMIGFGPTLWSRRFGETEYGVKAIPLGGYISMAGMYPPARAGAAARTASTSFFDTMIQDARDQSADTIDEGAEDRVFYRLAWWKRVIIMLGGPVMNLLIAVVLYTVMLCGFGLPTASTTIGSVSECLAPATQTSCTADDPASPAAAAGLQPGDRLVSVGGVAAADWDQSTAIIRQSAGEPVAVVVERDGAEVTLTVTPRLNERPVYDEKGNPVLDASGNPVTERVGMVGIGPAYVNVPQPVTAVLPAVWDNGIRMGQVILSLPQRLWDVGVSLFGGGERDPNGPMSVVGVGRLAGEITSLNAPIADRAASLVGVIAQLNIALFVFNLIPLLPLDGGHVIGAVWEALKRGAARLFKRPDPGPVDIAKARPLTLAVSGLLAVASVLLIAADIFKPISIL